MRQKGGKGDELHIEIQHMHIEYLLTPLPQDGWGGGAKKRGRRNNNKQIRCFRVK